MLEGLLNKHHFNFLQVHLNMFKASQFQMSKGRADSEVNISKVKLLSSP